MDVLMPQLGETVTEGKISAWYKIVGEIVEPGENLFEIETDKVSMDVPAIIAGVISEIRVTKGEVAAVGAIVAVIAEVGAETKGAPVSPAKPPAAVTSGNAANPSIVTTSTVPVSAFQRTTANNHMDLYREVRTPEKNFGVARYGGIAVTPLARRLAGESNIDLAKIKGSGPYGRIVANDVKQAAPQVDACQPTVTSSLLAVKTIYAETSYLEVPLDRMRNTIAKRLAQSKQTIPHFYLSTDVAVDGLLTIRKELNTAAPPKKGVEDYRISVNDFIIKALALALQRVPAANAVWAEDRILRFKHSDIGVAVAVADGLISPVIRNADTKRIGVISTEMRDLVARARERKVTPDDCRGGVSSVSNLGMFGVREFAAIINPPQSTVLAVGEVRRTPIEAADGSVRFQNQISITLSCDHRVVDGAVGSEMLNAIKSYLERPVMMLLHE